MRIAKSVELLCAPVIVQFLRNHILSPNWNNGRSLVSCVQNFSSLQPQILVDICTVIDSYINVCFKFCTHGAGNYWQIYLEILARCPWTRNWGLTRAVMWHRTNIVHSSSHATTHSFYIKSWISASSLYPTIGLWVVLRCSAVVTFRNRTEIKLRPLICVNRFWNSQVAKLSVCQRRCHNFRSAIWKRYGSCHLVKGSLSTSMVVVPALMDVKGPTISTDSTSQGSPAYKLCLLHYQRQWPHAWHTDIPHIWEEVFL